MNRYKADRTEEQKAPIYRICLTGGPCSGKTTVMTQIRNIMEEKGFLVYIVPEAATMLMKGGAIIDPSRLTDQQRINLQIDLMKA